MTSHSETEKIKASLHKSLEILEAFENCVLLDYPAHPNIGDHLIWLGEIFYLTNVLKTKISYAASTKDFSDLEMQKRLGKSPIVFHGGGNLGDLYGGSQKFRERIIEQHKDRPIIILPQSIYFADQVNLVEAARSFNSHPNLTLFVRDNYSYEIAQQYFDNCQIIKAPDMAFHMVNLPLVSFSRVPNKSILYHCRQDPESNQLFSPESMNLSDLIVEDWTSYIYQNQYYKKIPKPWRLSRTLEGLRQGTVIPKEWMFRQKWIYYSSHSRAFNTMHNPSLHYQSLRYMHNGVYQFQQYRLIITNRLHGHILCTLMKIPHVFLPNSYYKNEEFYKAWTYSVPFCRFVKNPSQVSSAVQELLNSFPS
ncbi:polysaccharide pyruvyl transferase family protein [Microcoleus sp. FACHB-SPT15]|uniref:polysaccharide pyruvyl transferase family protein n=1 Tax=Microcoleus sp. FACHB-SPT15 TaxID=2692830 RepID=UPI001783C4B1|nr:polysaccharide pyruvyl transferase family protein [Microcoleus sp. FACHB-SPT15]MBD1809594.1 polysaccharide pyruvyl transferase family protein [Microcoleus sp. FACHB-SPT15]